MAIKPYNLDIMLSSGGRAFMKYIVENEKGKAMIQTNYFSSISDKQGIKIMLKAGYKIRENGKIITKARLIELLDK